MQLQPLLSEYFIETGVLPVAVSRQLSVVQQPASINESDSLINPPSSSIVYSEIPETEQAQQNLVAFISSRLSISTAQAAELLDKEGNLENTFAETEVVDWPTIGRFQKQADGTISFLQTQTSHSYLPDILLKQNRKQPEVEPATEVAEPIIESAEPELLNEAIYDLEEPLQKDNWRVWAIVILVIAVSLILFRFL